MAFLAEIKGRLGLDIAPFERGLAKATKGMERIKEKAGKDLLNRLAPAALLAGFTSLLSKAQELRNEADEIGKSLSPAVRATAEMADNLDEAKSFLFDLSTKGVSGFKSGIESLTAGIIAMFDPSITKEQILAQLAVDKNADAERRASAKRMAAEGKARAEQEKKDAASISENFKKAAAEREKRRQSLLTIEQKIAEAQTAITDNAKIFNDETASVVQRSEALLALEQSRTLLADLSSEKKSKEAEMAEALDRELTEFFSFEAEHRKEMTSELESQTKELLKQKDAITQTLAAQAAAYRRGLNPTTGDVASGSRRIGPRARSQARELQQLEKKALELADAEQRKREELDGARSEGERSRFTEEGRKIREERGRVEGRIGKLRGGLEGRVSDIETNKAQLSKLEDIDKKLATLNTTLGTSAVQS